MERKEKKSANGKMSVPQFGGWEHKAAGVPTDYSIVFSQARANKKSQKNDLTEVKRLSLGNERGPPSGKHPHGQYIHANAHAHSHNEDAPALVRYL
ncbi:hypothetical protein VNO77_42788 [Canavalia gladiata]|uniref:RIN4 pathogenic type III effector avirulence factor Avr cleavage site domain-containing protein n=1 Tax=Canavalia gladiata TaxID=3824 RepID=A0AAN9PMC8_CANGL